MWLRERGEIKGGLSVMGRVSEGRGESERGLSVMGRVSEGKG